MAELEPQAGMMSDDHLLRVEGLHALIGHFHILHGVDLRVRDHEIMVLLGRNGAGKTTTLRCVMGLVRVRAGTIEFAGEDIKGLPPHAIARKKLTLVPEDQGIFSLLTVAENMQVAMLPTKAKEEGRRRLDFALSLFPDLKQAWGRKAGTLSGGQKQMLALARALINENKLMMLDEPSKGLAPVIVRGLVEVMKELRQYTSFLLVEQNLSFARKMGDTFSIISDGKTAQSGKMTDLIDAPETQRMYLGVHMGERESGKLWTSSPS
jgi:branched-chain amino acid transport system ATP-binding protein